MSGNARLKVLDSPTGGEPSWGIVKRSEDGSVLAIRTKLILEESLGHLYTVNNKTNMTASAYDYANKVMGVTIFFPPKVLDDKGVEQRNPCIVRDEHDDISRVIVKGCGFGINAVGNWMLLSETLSYELKPVIAQIVMKKWRKWNYTTKRKERQNWGEIFEEKDIPDFPFGEDNTSRLKTFHLPHGMALVAKLDHEDVIDILDDINHNIVFVDRKAQTVLRRRILKSWVGHQQVDPKNPYINVTCWMQDDRKSMEEISELIGKAERGEFKVENVTHGGELEEDEIDIALADNVDVDSLPDPVITHDVGVEESKPAPAKTEAKESEPKSKGIGESALYKKINKAWVPLTADQKFTLSKKWNFKLMKEVKEFNEQDANDLWADIESEKGSAS